MSPMPTKHALLWAVVASCAVAVAHGCWLDRAGLAVAIESGGSGGTGGASPTGGGGTSPTGGSGGTGLSGGGGTGGTGLTGGSGGSGGSGGGAGLTGGSGGGGPVSFVALIPANDRDAWADLQNGSVNLADFGDSQWNDSGGYQFALPIPPGATILEANLSVRSTEHAGSTGSYSVRIGVEDTSTPQPFVGAADEIRNRSFWGTTVSWQIPSGGLPVDQRSLSPSIATLVQHIVDLPTWQSGHYVSLGVWGANSGGGCREAISDRSAGAPNAATLRITYSPP